MEEASRPRSTAYPAKAPGPSAAGYAAIVAIGAALWWSCRAHPARLPVWAPWSFSWPEFLATSVSLVWLARGLSLGRESERMSRWRLASVLIGIGAIYAVLQTRFDYLAQHAFFINRVQHVVLHHLGPFLIALGRPGATIRRGMPQSWERAIASPPVVRTMRIVQQPLVAFVLFVGLFYVWLIPEVHFRAMLDSHLYALMNWSMVVDGVAFWSLVLDTRPKPPCRVSYPTRAALAFALTFPEIVTGMALTSIDRDLYPYYALCGRVFPSIGPVFSQEIGGIVIWIPPVMMSVIAVFLVLDAMRRHEEASLAPALAGRRPEIG